MYIFSPFSVEPGRLHGCGRQAACGPRAAGCPGLIYSTDLQMRHQKLCGYARASLKSRTFFIVNTAFRMASSGDFYRSFNNILNSTVIYIGKIGLEYVDSSDKLSDLC